MARVEISLRALTVSRQRASGVLLKYGAPDLGTSSRQSHRWLAWPSRHLLPFLGLIVAHRRPKCTHAVQIIDRNLVLCKEHKLNGLLFLLLFLGHLKEQILKSHYAQGWCFARSTSSTAYFFLLFQAWVNVRLLFFLEKNVPRRRVVPIRRAN
jgi:hypothetical protein